MIIAISGKINSGKDTVAKIIQILEGSPHFTNEAVLKYLNRPVLGSAYEIQKFADALKQCVCLFLGCTMEQLEDREFKEKELGEEWWYYKTPSKSLIPYLDKNQPDFIKKYDLIKLTPRLFMQLLGTQCGRQILHPNIWVNALMSEYKSYLTSNHPVDDLDWEPRYIYPNWIITDMRFSNELEAVKKREGVTIRVNREIKHQVETLGGTTNVPEGYFPTNQHESETALDHIQDWDYVINNDGSLSELIDKVREILIKIKNNE